MSKVKAKISKISVYMIDGKCLLLTNEKNHQGN